MALIPNEQQTQMIEQGFRDLISQDYFLIEKIKAYLSKEISEGKMEFKIIVQSEKHLVVHPLGKDGETLRFNL